MELSFFAVIWKEEVREEYGIENDHGVVVVADNEDFTFNASEVKRGRPKIRYADVFPLFKTEQEAEAFRKGNTDWEVKAVTLTL